MPEIEINEQALEAARKAVEDELIEWRDSGRFMISGNGFTVRNRDGSDGIMRMSTAFGLHVGIKACLDALPEGGEPDA